MLPFRIQIDQHKPGKINIRYTSYAEFADYQQCAENVIQKQHEIDLNRSYGAMRVLSAGGKQACPESVIKDTESEVQEYGSDQLDVDELDDEYQPKKLSNSGSFC
jgi:hypothetical protein